jgi:hypothetical protein
MMMVAMRPRVHSKKIKKIFFGVNYGFSGHNSFFLVPGPGLAKREL